MYNSFYDQKLVNALVGTAQQKRTTEAQLTKILDILGVVAISVERNFLDYIKSTYTDNISIIKLYNECLLCDSDNVRNVVTNTLKQLVSDASLRKDFSEYILSTVVFTVGDQLRRDKVKS
jgi:hypothetical protein